MSVDTDPYARVWFPRPIGAEPVAHGSPACATRGHDAAAVPSFRAFAAAVDAEPCAICLENYQQASDWTGADVRALREAHDLTQHELATHLPVAVSSIANWESQGVTPGPEAAAALAALDEDALADPTPWDALEPAIRRVYECDQCGQTFDTQRALNAHGHDPGRCDTCDRLDSNSLEWCLHRTQAHGKTYARLNGLAPGEFEAAAAATDTLPDLAERLGFSIQKTARLCQFFDVTVGQEPDVPDGDDSWAAHYDRAPSDWTGESA